MYSSLFRFRKNRNRDETEPLKQGSVDRACDSRSRSRACDFRIMSSSPILGTEITF